MNGWLKKVANWLSGGELFQLRLGHVVLRESLVAVRQVNDRLESDNNRLLDENINLSRSVAHLRHKCSLYWTLESYTRRLEAELRNYRKEKVKEWGALGLGDELKK